MRRHDEKGIVMVAVLGIIVVLSALSLAVATGGQMTTLANSLSGHAEKAFQSADGAAHWGLTDPSNFTPNMSARTSSLGSTAAALDATVTSTYVGYRALPGNLVIRTTDGTARPAQFGQGDGLGKMYHFRLDGRRLTAQAGVDPAGAVTIRAAKAAPCADCGN